MREPAANSVWEIRYRVLGKSAVWDGTYVCELLTGPDKGQMVIVDGKRFAGVPSGEGEYNNGMAPGRKRPTDA